MVFGCLIFPRKQNAPTPIFIGVRRFCCSI
nr:MAG TPA: hypothetical protein [Caudoviricetes sp.]DAU47696.1 MAG TPA: hypothetical protein [Caudoviricetes sp.]